MQGAVKLQNGLADIVFKVPKAQVHVISPDTGGGCGLRGKLFPETVMVTWAAKRLKRPVKWLADRGETFVCDPHGRDHVSVGEMAFDAEGHILGVRVNTHARSEEHTSELQSLMRISYAVFCLKKKNHKHQPSTLTEHTQ